MNSDDGKPDGHDALDHLYWRAEILQALFWMRGEGLADVVDPDAVAAFLVADSSLIAQQMARLAADGYLEQVEAASAQYRLTKRGSDEGGRSFHDDFAQLMHRGHGECSDDCWCHDPDHAGEVCPTHGDHHHHY